MKIIGTDFKNEFTSYSFKIDVIVLALICATGAVIRLVGIQFGLPQMFNTDETILVLATKQFFSGDLNPHNFYYPSLTMYVMHIVQRIISIFSVSTLNLPALHTICRVVVAMFGTATLVLVYFLGKKLVGRTTGILSAVILCFVPLHVINSHFATTDVPLTFMMVLSLFFVFRLTENKSYKQYINMGIMWGLALSTKLPALTLFVPIIIAHFYNIVKQHRFTLRQDVKNLTFRQHIGFVFISLSLSGATYFVFNNLEPIVNFVISVFHIDIWITSKDKIIMVGKVVALKKSVMTGFGVLIILYTSLFWLKEIKKLLLLLAAAVLFFLLTTPFALLDYHQFLSDFLHQAVVSQTTWMGMFADSSPAFITNFRALVNTFGFVLLIALVPGAFYCIKKCSIKGVLFISIIVFFYIYMCSWTIMFERYMVPMTPLLAVLAAIGIVTFLRYLLARLNSTSTIIFFLMVVLILAVPVYNRIDDSLKFLKYLLKKNTRTLAFEWGIKNLPPDSKILIENYAPQFDIAGFKIVHVHSDFHSLVDSAFVFQQGADFLTITDKMWNRKVLTNGKLIEPVAYSAIDNYADLVKEFKPSPTNPGPGIKIYKVRN